MAFGRLERRAGAQPMSEINMTPLIDVMLVLLVIFIVAAPLMASRLALDLPRTEGGRPTDAPRLLQLAVDDQGRWFVDDQPVTDAQLRERVQETARRDRTTEVLLRADRRVSYGRVAELIGLVQGAGLTRVGFVTDTIPTPQDATATPPR